MIKAIAGTIITLGIILSLGLAIYALLSPNTASKTPTVTPTVTVTATPIATETPSVRATAGGMALPAGPRAIALSPHAQAYTKDQLYRLIQVNWPGTPVQYDCMQALVDGSYLQGMYKTCHIVVGDPTQTIPVSYTVQIDGWRLIATTE